MSRFLAIVSSPIAVLWTKRKNQLLFLLEINYPLIKMYLRAKITQSEHFS